jgi:hypothetical protein
MSATARCRYLKAGLDAIQEYLLEEYKAERLSDLPPRVLAQYKRTAKKSGFPNYGLEASEDGSTENASEKSQ